MSAEMTEYVMTRSEWAHAANCVQHYHNHVGLAYALDRACWEFSSDVAVTIPMDYDAELYVLSALTEDVFEDSTS